MPPYTSPSRASYGVSFASSSKKNDHDISRAHCMIYLSSEYGWLIAWHSCTWRKKIVHVLHSWFSRSLLVTETPNECSNRSLQWRHNVRDSISNHPPHDCLLNGLFRRTSEKASKLRVTGFCAGNSPVTGEFAAQIASNTENISIWLCHYAILIG